MPKKDHNGKKVGLRVCIDISPANHLLNDDLYPIPNITDVLAIPCSLSGKETHRSSLDLTAAYHRFRMKSKLFVFKWNGKYYYFTCAFFGIKTMTAKFQRVMDSICEELNQQEDPWVASYVDDVMLVAPDKETCITRTVQLINILTDNKLIINSEKSQWVLQKINSLGYVVDGKGRHLHPSKVC